MADATPPAGEHSGGAWAYQPLPPGGIAQAIPPRRVPSSPAIYCAASAPQRAGAQAPSPPGGWLGGDGLSGDHVEVTMPASLQRQRSLGSGLGRTRVQAAALRSPHGEAERKVRAERFIMLPDTTPQAGEAEAEEEVRLA